TVYRLLQQKLDDNTYVWFNIPIRGRHADFVILNFQLGLLILEVKDWQLDQIRSMSPTEVVISTTQGSKRVPHPLPQARNYALRVADLLAADPLLTQPQGAHQGRLCLPFSYAVVWTRMRATDFYRQLPELYDNSKMLFKESLAPAR